jgi:hypothetical protein
MPSIYSDKNKNLENQLHENQKASYLVSAHEDYLNLASLFILLIEFGVNK